MRLLKYDVELKYYLKCENKFNEKEIVSHTVSDICKNIIENIENVVLHYVKLTNPLSFQTNFQKWTNIK